LEMKEMKFKVLFGEGLFFFFLIILLIN
jgi:hypothetical protein